MDKDFSAPLIFGRPFRSTAGAVIDVQVGTLSFQLCGERVDFSFPPPAQPLVPILPSPFEEPIPIFPLILFLGLIYLMTWETPHAV